MEKVKRNGKASSGAFIHVRAFGSWITSLNYPTKLGLETVADLPLPVNFVAFGIQ